MAERSSFGPVVLAGLASAGLAAVASAKPWLGSGSTGGSSDASLTVLDDGTRYPVASAVSLVLLAAWGVLLVTRGRVRRAFAVVALLAAVGLVVAAAVAFATLPDQAGSSFEELMGRGRGDTGFTGWFWTAAVTSVLALAPAGLAVRLVPGWPEMGSRYDAPGTPADPTSPEASSGTTVPATAPTGPPTGQPTGQPTGPDTDRDLWRALDEGRDPTDPAPS